MKRTLAELARDCGGSLSGDSELEIQGIATDSRRIEAGTLFIAIRGPRFDGHAYVEEALARGATAALISSPVELSPGASWIRVPDTVRALGEIAHARRLRFTGPVVAITGSNGKTTTKEMCAAILSAAGVRTRRSPGNYNNEIGLPISLLELEDDDELLVVELGMNHAGEIDALARIAEPVVGTITQIAPAHLGLLGSIEAIADAKGELFERIRSGGIAVVNQDDGRVKAQARRFAGEQIGFGSSAPADWLALDVESESGHGRFRLVSPYGETRVRLAVPGRHMVANALCAAATASATGLLGEQPLTAIRKGLEGFTGIAGRLCIRPGVRGSTVIDDSYNANPTSVEAALCTLREVAAGGPAVAVLGDMLELGERARELHAGVGERVSQNAIQVLVAVGPLSRDTARAARETGTEEVHEAEDAAGAAALLASLLRGGETVLVKGSLGMQMKQVADAIAGGTD